jgi:epoxide hydrolase-like predicted phosphatase
MIRAIIFDLGGVLVRTVDVTPRERLASRLGMDRSALEDFIFGGASGDRAQKGEINLSQHWENLASRLGFSVQQVKDLVDEFFAGDALDTALVDYVRTLHGHYKTALLSNAWDDTRQAIVERWHIDDAFDELIISSELGIVKPDPRIFQLVLDKLGVTANQAVFVDDMQRNVDGARRVGLEGICFQNPQQMKLDLERLLINHKG